jgi:PAS domain S-box-containing protein
MIVFLAPDEEIYATATATLSEMHPDIRIEQGLLSAGVIRARELARLGAEIIITRGGTAAGIKEALPDMIVVDIPITGFDILRTVDTARKYGTRIGVVAFPSMVIGVDCLGPILGVELRHYLLQNEFEAESRVFQAFRDGADVVIGGVITGQAARKQGVPCVLIHSGSEGILQSALEAKRIFEARLMEKLKGTLFRTVLDYSYEGVVSIDREERVVIFNPVASRITGITGADALGKPISQVLPPLNLNRLLHTGRDELGQIIELHGTQILCNKIPILVNEKISGAVATFQDTGKIQQWEAAIRTKIYAGGHTATFTFSDVIGDSRAIRDAVAVAKEFAVTDSSVLITGETGTGKEVFAQSIHNASKRAQKPFVAINCAALPAQILESELFGYVGGAFTGANQKGKSGLLEIAHGGTLFMDEIAEMDYAIQSKLLRVIQEKKVMRLGSDRVLPVDVRIIAATNKNLKQRVSERQFRADLYYRLNVLRLRLPPLRERREDIEQFARIMLQRFEKDPARPLQWKPESIDRLMQYEWPGNIRELQNTVERVVAVCRQDFITPALVTRMMRDDDADEAIGPVHIMPIAGSANEIRQALEKTRGRQLEAAKLLGISRSTLWRRMKVLGLRD